MSLCYVNVGQGNCGDLTIFGEKSKKKIKKSKLFCFRWHRLKSEAVFGCLFDHGYDLWVFFTQNLLF